MESTHGVVTPTLAKPITTSSLASQRPSLISRLSLSRFGQQAQHADVHNLPSKRNIVYNFQQHYKTQSFHRPRKGSLRTALLSSASHRKLASIAASPRTEETLPPLETSHGGGDGEPSREEDGDGLVVDLRSADKISSSPPLSSPLDTPHALRKRKPRPRKRTIVSGRPDEAPRATSPSSSNSTLLPSLHSPHSLAATGKKQQLFPQIKLDTKLDADAQDGADTNDYSDTEWWGWVILVSTWVIFVVGMGSCLDAWSWAWDVGETPYAPPELEDDATLPIVGYYPALMVMTGLMSWVWVTVAWVGIKYFRHAKVWDGED